MIMIISLRRTYPAHLNIIIITIVIIISIIIIIRRTYLALLATSKRKEALYWAEARWPGIDNEDNINDDTDVNVNDDTDNDI